MSSLARKLRRGRAHVLHNPTTKNLEVYLISKRGKWIHGAESLGLKQVHARSEKYDEIRKEENDLKETLQVK